MQYLSVFDEVKEQKVLLVSHVHRTIQSPKLSLKVVYSGSHGKTNLYL